MKSGSRSFSDAQGIRTGIVELFPYAQEFTLRTPLQSDAEITNRQFGAGETATCENPASWSPFCRGKICSPRLN
jgi:hypothetical protein